MAPHLPDDDIHAYAQRRLAPADLLSVDAHLAACGDCRGRLPAPAADPRALFRHAEPTAHLDEDAGARLVDGALDAVELELAEAHLEGCAACRAEVEALRSARAEIQPARTHAPARSLSVVPAAPARRWLAVAATLALVALGSWWMLRDTPAPAVVARATPAPAAVEGVDELPLQLRQRVTAALQTGRLELVVPPELTPGPQQLMGSPASARFRVLRPAGTVVATAQPAFEWQALDGARSYEVLVLDPALTVVAQSPRLRATTWTVPTALAPDVVYTWQVAATVKGQRVVAPAPPEPEARFRILDAQTAQAIAAAPSAVARAVLYASAGARDAARAELEREGSPEARRLLDSITR